MRNANLERADFSRADFRGAYVAGANLTGADLKSADMREGRLMERDDQAARWSIWKRPGVPRRQNAQDHFHRREAFRDESCRARARRRPISPTPTFPASSVQGCRFQRRQPGGREPDQRRFHRLRT
jgi:uncharacterized protein YjbI with pentapeptide repeats